MLSKDNYIEQDMKIDDTFLNYQKILIYELLNNEGLKYIFDYNDIPTSNIVSLKNQKIEILNNPQLQSSNTKSSKILPFRVGFLSGCYFSRGGEQLIE